MIKRYLQPEFLFQISGILIITYRLLFVREPLEIVTHDTYIVVNSLHVTFLIAILFVILSFPYTLFRISEKPLSRVIGWMHYILTLFPWLTVFIVLPLFANYQSHHFSKMMEQSEKFTMIIVVSCMLCLLGQLLFLVNILTTLLKGKKSIR